MTAFSLRRSTLVLSLVAVPHLTLAQTTTVQGEIHDSLGRPVAEALVELLGGKQAVRSTSSGQFMLTGVKPGLDVIRVRALGFRPYYTHLRIPLSGWKGIVELEPVTTVLPDLIVRTRYGKPAAYANTTKYDDFFRRRRLGIGRFLTREDLEKRGVMHLGEALHGIPGIRVSWPGTRLGSQWQNWLEISRCSPLRLAFYLNGEREYSIDDIGRSRGQEALRDLFDVIAVRDVEFMEVYRGAAQIPSDLARDVCAVIAVWTR